MPLDEDTPVVSLKFAATLVIAPVPLTSVALAKVMPRLMNDVSSKFTAPVTVGASAVEKLW